MASDRYNLQPEQNKSVETNKEQEQNAERFESDTERIMHRHLANENDIITDEDIAGVRIGMTPPLDEATESRFEGKAAEDAVEEKYIGKELSEENENQQEDHITPWDIVDPS